MRLNDNNTFIGINPPYQLSVIHSSKLIYPREIYQRGVERKRVELIATYLQKGIRSSRWQCTRTSGTAIWTSSQWNAER